MNRQCFIKETIVNPKITAKQKEVNDFYKEHEMLLAFEPRRADQVAAKTKYEELKAECGALLEKYPEKEDTLTPVEFLQIVVDKQNNFWAVFIRDSGEVDHCSLPSLHFGPAKEPK